MTYRYVLFDLDGTLSDSEPGIFESLRWAFDQLRAPWPEPAVARALLGPPFWRSLPPLVGEAKVSKAIELYRQHYVAGGAMLRTSCYPGVVELLAALAERGSTLAVATSKPEQHASRIVEYLGLAGYFSTVCGDTLDGQRDTKALVVGEALRRLGQPPPAEVLMVGDRSHDVLGAREHGIDCAGALWGYGSSAELTEAGAWRLCGRPGEVLELIDVGLGSAAARLDSVG